MRLRNQNISCTRWLRCLYFAVTRLRRRNPLSPRKSRLNLTRKIRGLYCSTARMPWFRCTRVRDRMMTYSRSCGFSSDTHNLSRTILWIWLPNPEFFGSRGLACYCSQLWTGSSFPPIIAGRYGLRVGFHIAQQLRRGLNLVFNVATLASLALRVLASLHTPSVSTT